MIGLMTTKEQDGGAIFNNTAFNNVPQGLHGHYRQIMMRYWQNLLQDLETEEHDFRLHQLPLARIKKVMKADEDVRMISAEAPILFAKGCDVFITELTMRAWIHAEENKRRTLQRSDIANALAKSDMFDFLIDIVPREEVMESRQQQQQVQQHGPERSHADMPPHDQAPPPPNKEYRLPEHEHNMPPEGYQHGHYGHFPSHPQQQPQQQPVYEMENMYAYPQIPQHVPQHMQYNMRQLDPRYRHDAEPGDS